MKEIKGTDEMVKKICGKLDSMKNADDSVEEPQAIEDLKKQFGEGAMKESMESMVGGWYPDHQVGLEESWTGEISITKGMPMTISYNNTLKFRHDGVAIIKTHNDIKMNPNSKPMKLGPMTMQYNLNGTMDGYLWLDEETGWTRGSKMTQMITGTIKVKGAPDMPEEGVDMPITIKGIVKTISFDIPPVVDKE